MKLVVPFLSIVAVSCSSAEPRAWWPSPAETGYASSAVGSSPRAPVAVAQHHAHDDPDDARIMLLLGMRFLDEDDYEPVEDQPTLGIDFSYEPPGSFVGFEVGLMGSYDEDDVLGTDLEVSTGEIYAGLRKTFGDRTSGLHPYLGLGVSVITVDVELEGFGSDDDTSLAGYVHGGLLAYLGRSFFVGADARALFGSDIEIAGVSADADYGQLALVLGWSF